MSYPCKIKIELTDVDGITTVASKVSKCYIPSGELNFIGEFINDFLKSADFSFFNKDTILLKSLTFAEHNDLLKKLTALRNEEFLIKDAHLSNVSPIETDEQITMKFFYKNEEVEIEYVATDIVQQNVIQTIFKLINNFIQLTGLDSKHKNLLIITESLSFKEADELRGYLREIRTGKF